MNFQNFHLETPLQFTTKLKKETKKELSSFKELFYKEEESGTTETVTIRKDVRSELE